MSYQVKVDAAAETDLDEAIAWYENQRAGLGIDFLYKFYDAVAYLKENPRQYPEVYAPFRRALMKNILTPFIMR
jgi:hypothetical protein